jgi:hypothetical protein
VLPAGSHTLAVTFTPADATNFTGAQTSVSLTVERATPAPIVYGTPLGAAQFGASATVAGQFSYGRAAGALLGAGSHDLTVLFTPTDSDNYTTATGATTLLVHRAPLTVTANAASRDYGGDDPPFFASYATFVAGESERVLTGTLACASDATRLSPVGNGYRIACSGLVAANYTLDYRPGALTIARAGSALTPIDAEVVYGAAMLDVAATLVAPGPPDMGGATFAIVRDDQTLRSAAATGISGPAVRGTLSPVGLVAGDYTLVARYAGDRNVAPSEGRARLRVAKAGQTIAFAPPTVVPLAAGTVQLTATASSGLTVTFAVAPDAPCAIAGAVLTPLRAGACAITATQDGDANHFAAQGVSRTIQIAAPPPTETATPSPTVSPVTATATLPTATPIGTPIATVTVTPPVIPSASTPIVTVTVTPPTPTGTLTPVPTPTPTPAPSDTPAPTPAPAQVTLTLTANAGGGVSASAPGPRYPAGTRLTLRATPATGALFVGWTVDGVAQGWSPTLIVTLRADRRVEARFAPRPAFGDLATDARAADPIAQLAARGIIRGYGDGSYGPADPILRAQMAALIVRALGWDGAAGGPAPFDDRDGVDAELWRAIGTLATRGIARGYGDGTYHPRDPVLHIQAVSFVARADRGGCVAAPTGRSAPLHGCPRHLRPSHRSDDVSALRGRTPGPRGGSALGGAGRLGKARHARLVRRTPLARARWDRAEGAGSVGGRVQ